MSAERTSLEVGDIDRRFRAPQSLRLASHDEGPMGTFVVLVLRVAIKLPRSESPTQPTVLPLAAGGLPGPRSCASPRTRVRRNQSTSLGRRWPALGVVRRPGTGISVSPPWRRHRQNAALSLTRLRLLAAFQLRAVQDCDNLERAGPVGASGTDAIRLATPRALVGRSAQTSALKDIGIDDICGRSGGERIDLVEDVRELDLPFITGDVADVRSAHDIVHLEQGVAGVHQWLCVVNINSGHAGPTGP